MTPRFVVIQGGSTKTTEQYLLDQPGVIDASVWMDEDQLLAHVTLEDSARWDERSLKVACARELGLACTPSRIILRCERLHAA